MSESMGGIISECPGDFIGIGTGQEDAVKKRADLAKEGFEKALANMRELAEMATKSQKEAFEVVRKRIEENVEGIRNFGKKAE